MTLVLLLGLMWALAADLSEADRVGRLLARPRPELLTASVRATEPTTDPKEAAQLVAYVHEALSIPKPNFYLTSFSALTM